MAFFNFKDVLLDHVEINGKHDDENQENEEMDEDEGGPKLYNHSYETYVSQQCKPSDIFNFLRDMALKYIAAMNAKQYDQTTLDNEFMIICLLNALFGDPRFHLVHLYPNSSSEKKF